MLRAALLPAALLLAGCGGGAPPPPDSVAHAADTLRGVLEVVGSEPASWPVIRGAAGGADVALVGDGRLLRRLAGLEVVVRGGRLSDAFRVDAVTVRAADGVPAVDGVLAREGAGWVLVTGEGRRLPIAALPEGLRGREGARVWLAGPPGAPPSVFGVIAGAP